MSVHRHYLQTPEEGIGSYYRWLWATMWELNSGPLEEQSVLLTADPSLQPQGESYYYNQDKI